MAVDVIIFRGTADVLFQIHEHALTVPAGNVVVDVQLERKAGVLFDRPFAGTRDQALIGVKADDGTGAVAEGSDGMRVEHRLDALCLGLTHGRGKDGVSLLSDVHVLHDDLTEAVAAVQKRLQILRGLRFTFTQNVWLYRTSGCAKQAIVLYEYQPTRKAEHAEAFLKGFSGWLHADGYQGYHRLPGNIRVVGCWAHARRKFDEALGPLPQEKQKDSPAAIGECYCSQLFKLEQALAELTPEERYEKRLEQEKPVLDALLSWANEMQAKTAPKSALGKAIHYLQEQWPYLTRYLEDGRLELSNNRAERSIKPFVMGRKNWLFANTPGGAQACSVIYSLIETAKENSLDPYRYLLWILQTAPQLSETNKPWAESLLPANAPEECYMPHK